MHAITVQEIEKQMVETNGTKLHDNLLYIIELLISGDGPRRPQN